MNISISNTLDSISDLLEWKQCCTENCCYQWKTIIHSVLSSSNWFFLPIDFLSSQNVSPINDPQNLGFENICSHQQKHKNELYIYIKHWVCFVHYEKWLNWNNLMHMVLCFQQTTNHLTLTKLTVVRWVV